MYVNVQANLARQGIASGFGFLDNSAGFSIIMHLIEFDQTSSYGRVFVIGILNTLLVAFAGIVLATIIGVAIGVARLSSNGLVASFARVYIEIFRNIPLLLQLFFWYFVVLRALPSPRMSINVWDIFIVNNRGFYLPKPLPGDSFIIAVVLLIVVTILIAVLSYGARAYRKRTGKRLYMNYVNLGIIALLIGGLWIGASTPLQFEYPQMSRFGFRGGLVLIPEFIALLLALSIYTAAFIAEVVRAGLTSVSKGQLEAAHSVGLTPLLTLRLVIFPQALRVIIPPLTNQYLNLTKNSSLAAAIAYPDLVSVFAGTVLNQTGQAVEVIMMTMAVYLSISLTISLLMNLYHKHHTHWGAA